MRYLRYAAPVLLTGALLGLLAATVDVRGLSRSLRLLSPPILTAAIGIMFVHLVISSFRYRRVLHSLTRQRTRLSAITALNLLSLFYAHILPAGALADGIRAHAAWRLLDLPPRVSIEGVVHDRLLALGGLIVCGLALLPVQSRIGVSSRLILAQALIFSAALIATWAAGRIGRFRSSRIAVVACIAAAIDRFFAQLATPRACTVQILLAAASVGCFAAMLALIARGLDIPLSLTMALAIAPTIYLSQVIPLFYAGFGAREMTVIVLLTGVSSIGTAQALSLSLVVGLCNLLVSLPGAAVAFWLTGRRRAAAFPGGQ